MSNLAYICMTVAVIVIGAFGLYQVAFKQGYVRGYEDGADLEEVEMTLDEGDDK